jgi:murein DD-endopeptidase MepM/ murein hydrolase activator NlpD
VGNTGDAEPTPPHLHFEIHPDGGDAVDPHPFLVRWLARAGNLSADTAERPGALVEVRDFIGEG